MKAIYPISGNPFHNGHMAVYNVACEIFDDVIILICVNPNKTFIQPEFLLWTMKPLNLNVELYTGCVADYCIKNDIEFIVRGVRNGHDLDYEMQMDDWNTKLSNGKTKTIIVPTKQEYVNLSSSIIREIRSLKSHDEAIKILSDKIDPVVFSRWSSQYTGVQLNQKRGIFFGKSCVGKTTYINRYLREINQALEIDKVIYDYLDVDDVTKLNIRHNLLQYMQDGNITGFSRCICIQLANKINWKKMLDGTIDVDFPALGHYIEFIPSDILSQYKIIKLTCDEDVRQKRIDAKGFRDKIAFFDSVYIDAPYWDDEINLTK